MKKLIFLMLMAAFSITHSQSLSVWNLNSESFPVVSASFYALDNAGKQIADLNIPDMQVRENDIERKILSITCPQSVSRDISSVLVIDVSSSMEGGRLSIAQAAANQWINMLNLGPSECALTSFSDKSYLNQDLTTQYDKLQRAIQSLSCISATNYNDAFLNSYSGAIPIVKKGGKKRIIVFLSDGVPNDDPQTDLIISEAQRYDITVYCMAIEMPAPDCMKRIAKETGGKYIENVMTPEQAKEYYADFLMDARGIKPCEITWESQIACSASGFNVSVKVLRNGSFTNISYTPPRSSNADLDIIPYSIVFKNIKIGEKVDTIIKVTAINSDFNVNQIECSNPLFSISPDNFNLPQGKSINLTVSYTAIDSSYQKAEFTFKNSLCDRLLLARTILKPYNNVNNLKVVHPNGGEVFLVGNDTVITWTGVLPTDTVGLEYSYDAGENWHVVAEKASGLVYNWKNIPQPASEKCLVRAALLNTDVPIDSSDRVQFLSGYKSVIYNAGFSPDGRYIVASSNPIIFWDAETLEPIDTIKFAASDFFFSPDSKYFMANFGVATYIYNLAEDIKTQTPAQFSNFYVSPTAMNDAGTMLASYSISNRVEIWDISKIWQTSELNKITTLKGFSGSVFKMAFSHNGKYLLIACADNTLQIWDTQTWEMLNDYGGNAYYVNSIAFSPDDSKIAVGSYIGTVRIWNTEPPKLLKALNSTTFNVRAVAFSPDGRMLAAGDDDKKIYLWDLTRDKLIHTFKGHQGIITSLRFSPDGTKIVSGSMDARVGVWSIDHLSNVVDTDESDSLFSIVEPNCTVHDIDMGEIDVNNYKDSLVANFIENAGNYPARVDSIKFLKNDGIFKLVPGFSPYTIEKNKSGWGEFEFLPTTVGGFFDTVIVYTQNEILKCEIKGAGIQNPGKLINNIVDFGLVLVGSQKDSNHIYTIKNISNSPLTIDSTVHGYPNSVDFSTLAGGGTFTLKPFESHQMDLRFKPSEAGKTQGTLLFYYNGGGSPAAVQLYGEGYVTYPKINAELDSIPRIICEDASYAELRVTNTGGDDLEIQSLEFTGQNFADFSVPGFTGLVLKRDSTETIKIQFFPASVGTKYATLEIKSNANPDSLLKFDISATKDSIYYDLSNEVIDLGTLCTNEIRDTSFSLKNSSIYPVGIYFKTTANLKINQDGTQLPLNKSVSIPCHFDGLPTDGDIKEEIEVIDSICGVKQRVKIIGQVITPILEANDIQIISKINETGSGKIILKNTGKRKITVNKLPEIGTPFHFVNNPFPADILPNENIELEIEFNSPDTLKHNSLIKFEAEPCSVSVEANILGEAYDNLYIASGTIKAGSASAYSGETVKIPIILSDTSEFYDAGIKSINMELGYNPTLLEPVNYTGEIISDNFAKLKLIDLPIQLPELAGIEFKSGLGNAASSPLNILNVRANGGEAQLETVDGTFNLLGICPEGGPRLLNPNSKISINIKPNPSTGIINIDLNLTEEGKTSLTLVDATGKIVKNLFEKNSVVFGSYSIVLTTNDLNSGEYFIVLKTPTYIKSGKIEIIK